MNLQAELNEIKALVVVLLAKIEVLEKDNCVLKAENASLKVENAELRARLGLNSSNSNKSPSTDGLSKKPTTGLAKASGKKSGGQVGHPGKSLQMVATADETIVHHASRCSCCQQLFSLEQVSFIQEKRQVFDLPEPKVVVTEHQLGIIYCCGKAHVGSFPASVTAPVSYGVRIRAMSSLLNTDFRLPLEKISQLFLDLYGCPYNESTIISANERLYENLAPIEEAVKAAILKSQVAHFDETGMRVEGKLHWFHTACTGLLCYLFVHKKRGKQALRADESLLKDFHNWAIHDCWKPYFEFKDCKHGLCNAHILRELISLQESGSQWACLMQAFLLELYKESQKETLLVENKHYWLERYKKICLQADKEEPLPIKKARGKPKNSKGRNLLNRLIDYQDGILAFAFTEPVPFTNNMAERAIRCIKVKQKVAMSFRTFNGAKVFARIQGFVTTCRKQDLNVFQQVVAVLKGLNPLLNAT
jgi:transposase